MPSPYIYAFFANDVYSSTSSTLPSGWEVSTDSAERGYTGGNYFGRVYINDRSEYIIAHRGTEILSISNWWSNVQNMFSAEIKTYNDVTKKFLEEVIGEMTASGRNFLGFTGHSLGSMHASLSALDFPNSLGDPSDAFLFEFPCPYQSIRQGNAYIYNAAPNLVNTLRNPENKLYRLFPDYGDSLPSFESKIPDVLKYLGYTVQQHSMSAILAQFNPLTGEPKLYSIVERGEWPYGTDPTGLITYTGYADYSSYGLNPYYWNRVLTETYESPVAFDVYKTLYDYKSSMFRFLSPREIPTTGRLITGDDTGNEFIGGTSFTDSYYGGAGSDRYYLFEGDDNITDTGGRNSYVFTQPIRGVKTIRDANPEDSVISMWDGSRVTGAAYKINKFGQPISRSPSRFLQSELEGYATFDSITGRAFVSAFSGNDFLVGDRYIGLQNDGIRLPGFSWGDFSIAQQPKPNILTKATWVNSLQSIITPETLPFPTVLYASGKLIMAYEDIGYVFQGAYLLTTFTLTHKHADSTIKIYPFLSSSSNENGLFPIMAIETYEIQVGNYTETISEFHMKVFDSFGNQRCNSIIPRKLPSQFVSDRSGNFLFTTPGGVDSTEIYTLNPYSCSLSHRPLPGIFSPGFASIPSGGYVFANFNQISFKTFITFTDLNFITQTAYMILGPFAKDLTNNLDVNSDNEVVFLVLSADDIVIDADNPTDMQISLKIYNPSGFQAERLLYSGTSFPLLSKTLPYSLNPTWIDEDNLLFLEPNLWAYPSYYSANIYDDRLNFVKTIYTLPARYGSIYGYRNAAELTDDSSGFLASGLLEYDSTTGIIYPRIAITPFRYNDTDVIITNSQAGTLDCSKSKALNCFAISQNPDDVLIATPSQSATLIGTESSQTFKFRDRTTSSQLAAKRELSETSDEIVLSDFPDYENYSSSGLRIWGMDLMDTIDLSGLSYFDQLRIDNSGNSTYIYDSDGRFNLTVMRSPTSSPFNLSFGAGGIIRPALPIPSPIPIGVEDSGISGIVVAGIVLGTLALGAAAYAGYRYCKNWSKAAPSSSTVNSSTSGDLELATSETINPIYETSVRDLSGHQEDIS
jgi:hypothetical protein